MRKLAAGRAYPENQLSELLKAPREEFLELCLQQASKPSTPEAGSMTRSEEEAATEAKKKEDTEGEPSSKFKPSIGAEITLEGKASAKLKALCRLMEYTDGTFRGTFQYLVWYTAEAFFEKLLSRRSQDDVNNKSSCDGRDTEILESVMNLGMTQDTGQSTDDFYPIRQLFNIYANGPENYIGGIVRGQNNDWKTLSANVGAFCELAGGCRIGINPFISLESLRESIANRKEHVTGLYDIIQRLQNDNQSQKKSIQALVYRHVLEHLPGPDAIGKTLLKNGRVVGKLLGEFPLHKELILLVRYAINVLSMNPRSMTAVRNCMGP